jgi:hypothetical protein
MSEASHHWLKDFDWSVRTVLSSDKLNGLKKPLLVLTLETTTDGISQSQLIELTSDELKLFLEELRASQKVVHSLKASNQR